MLPSFEHFRKLDETIFRDLYRLVKVVFTWSSIFILRDSISLTPHSDCAGFIGCIGVALAIFRACGRFDNILLLIAIYIASSLAIDRIKRISRYSA